MHEEVFWTYLSSTEIARRLADLGTPVCSDTVRGLVDDFGFHKRQAEKTKTMGQSPFRNEQFENIARLKQQYLDSANPIISMDTKKKEFLGELFRAGRVVTLVRDRGDAVAEAECEQHLGRGRYK